MNNLPEKVKKYLVKYSYSNLPAGQAGWELEWNENKNISHVVVVPAICEFENIKKLLTSLSQNNNKYFSETLIIFIINNSKSSDNNIKLDNHKCISLLREYYKVKVCCK